MKGAEPGEPRRGRSRDSYGGGGAGRAMEGAEPGEPPRGRSQACSLPSPLTGLITFSISFYLEGR